MKLILLILLVINIYSPNPGRFLSRRPRELEENLQFEQTNNLIFGEDSKWHFDIKYISENQLAVNTECSTSILFKGVLSTASCKAASDFMLNCELNQSGQTKLDLVQLTNEKANDATITWTSLDGTKNIPISTTLKYDDSYGLTYDTTSKDWSFKVKIKEESLPDESLVILDLDYKNTEKIQANCIHRNKILNCEFNKARGIDYTIKISQEKTQGSINWIFPSPLEENYLVIPCSLKVSSYRNSYDLELIDNQWNYKLFIQVENWQAYHYALTINTKIKNKQNEENLYFTRCNSVDNSLNYNRNEFKCKVYGNNQKITDLVYVSNSNMNDISLIWDGKLANDDIIVRKAELSFIKVYDLLYDSTSRYWTFKIEVADDNDIPNEALVYVDIYASNNNGNFKKICSLNEHILSCTKSDVTDSTNLIKFQSYKEKGSVTWKNVKQKHISIALNHEFIFIKVSGSFFSDKWKFFISVTNTKATPKYSTIIIDIKHNNIETTATCETLKEGSNNSEEMIYCTSDYPTQTSQDTITINQEKKSGSITWRTGLTESNNIVQTITLTDKSAELSFIDAYDLYFSKNKWYFTLSTRGSTRCNIGKYRVDIAISGKSPSTATCFLKEGKYSASNITFFCECDYGEQSKDDLIYIAKEKSESSSINFSPALNSDYQIILKTELTIKKAHSARRDGIKNWFFKINIVRNSNTILPVNSIVFVDIFEEKNRAKCIAESTTVLSCETDYSSNNQITLGYLKRDTASVTWTNLNKNDYTISSEPYTDPNPGEEDPVTPIEQDPTDQKNQNDPENPNQGQKGQTNEQTNYSNYLYYYSYLFLLITVILL